MEYPVHWGIVFSDVVVRSAEALKQYRLLAARELKHEGFEATLTLSVAQTILAAAKELHSALEREQPEAAGAMAEDLTAVFAQVQLEESTWLSGSGKDPVNREDLTGERILEHLRNSVSHPVPGFRSALPMTGYATVPQNGCIWGFRFTHSPWVKRAHNTGDIDVYPGRDRARIDPEGILEKGTQGGRSVWLLPGNSTAYYPLLRLFLTVADLGQICDDIAGEFERWQKELSRGREQNSETKELALSTALR